MMPRHYISPSFTTDDFPDGPKTIEDKLKVFEDRVRGWQLNIALQTIKRDRHSVDCSPVGWSLAERDSDAWIVRSIASSASRAPIAMPICPSGT
jgi:hypothetical protein